MKKVRIISFIIAIILIINLSIMLVVANYEPKESNILLHLKTGEVDLSKNKDNLTVRNVSHNDSKLYVVQFNKPIVEEFKELITNTGADIGSYLPDYAFLVKMNSEQKEKINKSPNIENIRLYKSEWKISPEIKSKNESIVLINTFGKLKGNFVKKLNELDAKPVSEGKDKYVTHLKKDEIVSIAKSDNVEFIEELKPTKFYNTNAAKLIGLSGKNKVWENGLTGKGQVVGIADGGIGNGDMETMHKDLIGSFHVEPFALARPNDWSDLSGHGTHIAGTILSRGKEYEWTKGMAYEAKMVFQSVSNKDGDKDKASGGGVPEDLNILFSQAKDAGAHIHTNSWGKHYDDGGHVYESMAKSLDEFTNKNKDFTILFAVGNEGAKGNNTVTAPSTAKNSISVGGTRPKENPFGLLVNWSAKGPAPDGRLKPDIVAPGETIYSCESSYGQIAKSGTSMATAVAAGATVIVRQFYTDIKNIIPSSALIKATLINGAKLIDSSWMSLSAGWGLIDVNNSLFPEGKRKNIYLDEKVGLKTEENKTYNFRVKSDEILKVSVVWSDAPSALEASKNLVNDLDIELIAPDGKVYMGNCFKDDTSDSDKKEPDKLNNVENVYIKTPVAGDYTLNIKGYNVPEGPQDYAVVISGTEVEFKDK